MSFASEIGKQLGGALASSMNVEELGKKLVKGVIEEDMKMREEHGRYKAALERIRDIAEGPGTPAMNLNQIRNEVLEALK